MAPGTRAAGARLREAIHALLTASPVPWTAPDLHDRFLQLGSLDQVRRALYSLVDKGFVVMAKGDFHFTQSTFRAVETSACNFAGHPDDEDDFRHDTSQL